MFGSTIIDVAIGLIFIYFLLSMITAHINELLATIFRWRAADLETGIRNMLSDSDLANKVWNHPIIRSLAVKAGRNPSYIPANTFSLALFDALAPAGSNPTALESVRTQVAALPENSARNALLAMNDRAQGNFVQAQSEVENWFNSVMDRVSGAYKQRILWVTVLVSLFVTVIFGVDSIALANSLWSEPGLRAALNGAAGSIQTTENSATSGLQDAVKMLNEFTFPIGWSIFPTTLAGWVQKLAGLLLTTVAVSLGAPFWFELLKNVGNLRSSKPPPK